ncbi:sialidase family protein [Chitinophaga agri]|uniref:Exo-alpha-sialidase n=1 Tax=Chitinophaga agri TaxID=2703787 RepID=A0A6B9ZKR3_9BACT|nr:sialidase family protein [Chitinophaga agri]QHS61994.1 exo-alpha-sialidase [Chitinophaga agri]
MPLTATTSKHYCSYNAKQLLNAVLIYSLTALLFISGCKKADNQQFYEVIENTPITDADIHLIGDVHNLPLTSQKIFVPDNVKTGGYAYASVLRLNDSSLMVACTRYPANSFGDFNHSDIAARISHDNGATWEPEFVLQENIGLINTCNPNLVRITNKKIVLIFCVKDSDSKIDILIKESEDNGVTWGSPRLINKLTWGYHIVNNDRAIYNNGRLIVPAAYAVSITKDYDKQVIFCYYSDDQGKTWRKSSYLKADFALMEPGVTAINKNGKLKMNIRTKQGFIYFSTSDDNGMTWKGLFKSNINTPEAPQVVTSLNKSDSLMMIWINTPYTPGMNNRNPLTFAYSTNAGQQWQNPVNLRNNKDLNFLYPTIYKDRNDTIMVTYGVRDITFRPSIYLDRLSLKTLIK